jgi:hypothetical protein
VCEVFVESSWRGRAARFDREQQSDQVPGRDQASQAKVMVASAVSADDETVSGCAIMCAS